MLCQNFVICNVKSNLYFTKYEPCTLYIYLALQWQQTHHYDKLTAEIQRKTTHLMFERTKIGEDQISLFTCNWHIQNSPNSPVNFNKFLCR